MPMPYDRRPSKSGRPQRPGRPARPADATGPATRAVEPADLTHVVAPAARVDGARLLQHGAPVRGRRHRDGRARPRGDRRGGVPTIGPGDPAPATAGRDPPSPRAMHRPVPAAQDPVEMVALAPAADQSRGGTTATGAEVPRRDVDTPRRDPRAAPVTEGDRPRRYDSTRPSRGEPDGRHWRSAPEPARAGAGRPSGRDRVAPRRVEHPEARHRSAPPR